MKPKHVAKRHITLLLVGTPGVGKTTLAQSIAKPLHAQIISEKAFVRQHRLGEWNTTQTNEYEVDIFRYQKKMNAFLHTTPNRNIIIEGHLGCEGRLNVKGVIILTCPLSALESRLRKRKGYSELKIQDNLFCEEQKYCQNQAKKNYSGKPILVLSTHRPKKVIRDRVIDWIRLHFPHAKKRQGEKT